jgi:hypothetical protein
MLCDDGAKVVDFILNQLRDGLRVPPTEISLKYIEEETGVRPQNTGMAFDSHIKSPLNEAGYVAVKQGTPVRIRLTRK